MATKERSRSGVEGTRLGPLCGAMLGRRDVQFLSREPETGGTPTLPGVEFVRYRRSCGVGFRATGPQTPRIAVRAVFPGTTGARVGYGLAYGPDGIVGCYRTPGWRGPSRNRGGRIRSVAAGQRSAAAPAPSFGG